MILRHFVSRRAIWFPTLLGWAALVAVPLSAAILWLLQGESFLSQTKRLPADVMVVEGWIGIEGIRAAGTEFEHGGYRFIVATGGLTNDRWDPARYTYASLAVERLLEMGIPRDKIIIATPTETEGHRTFQSAAAVWRVLHERNIYPTMINVFTFGTHARRSRIVFSKILGPETKVGVISWVPPGYTRERWWHSSERSGEMLRETAGWLFEGLLNSGRTSNSRR